MLAEAKAEEKDVLLRAKDEALKIRTAAEQEAREARNHRHHRLGVVDHDYAAGAKHRSPGNESLVIHQRRFGLFAGHDVWSDAKEAKARLGYLDEEPIVYPHLTGREFLHLVADLYGSQRGPDREIQLKRLFDLFEFADKADELISSYSHGTKQKVGLASVLIHEPEVMLLDEPTNGLDPRAARRVKDLLQELAAHGRTVILSTHILEIAQALCDRVAIMNRGRVVAVGTLEELRSGAGSSEASLEELFLQLTGGAESKDVIDQLMKS